MRYSTKLYTRPAAKPANKEIVNDIFNIAKSLTGKWFTENVPDDTRRDLHFHDVFCLQRGNEILSFLVFTSWDGMLYITLMGTLIDHQRTGLGSILIEHFCNYARELGFVHAAVMTVPEDVKPAFAPTIRFYEKQGFKIIQRYSELWESGALLLLKEL